MSGQYRTQLAAGSPRTDESPLEGEPRWDAVNRKLGFWNFALSKMQWFRIPGEGENENYVPEHSWDGKSLMFKNPDGTWGEAVDLEGAGIASIDINANEDFSLTLKIVVSNDGVDTIYGFTTEPLKGVKGDTGPAGAPPLLSLSIDNQGMLIFTAQYGDLEAVSAEINDDGELIITYDING